jgi:hypothetical protein
MDLGHVRPEQVTFNELAEDLKTEPRPSGEHRHPGCENNQERRGQGGLYDRQIEAPAFEAMGRTEIIWQALPLYLPQ